MVAHHRLVVITKHDIVFQIQLFQKENKIQVLNKSGKARFCFAIHYQYGDQFIYLIGGE